MYVQHAYSNCRYCCERALMVSVYESRTGKTKVRLLLRDSYKKKSYSVKQKTVLVVLCSVGQITI